MRAHQNTWGRVSQTWKLVYGIQVVVCVWLIEGDRLGMLPDAQASQCDSTAHV